LSAKLIAAFFAERECKKPEVHASKHEYNKSSMDMGQAEAKRRKIHGDCEKGKYLIASVLA
jgi:hypothetical protein